MPITDGDGMCAIDCPSETLGYLADLVGPKGQVCAWSSSGARTPLGLAKVCRLYPKIILDPPFPGGRLYQPRDLHEVCYELIQGSYGRGVLSKLGDYREPSIKLITGYLASCNLKIPIGCVFIFYPPTQPRITPSRVSDYEQHLIRTVEPMCRMRKSDNSASSFWIAIELRFADCKDYEIDQICDRCFDLIADFARPEGSVRPKEQLRINPEYMESTYLLTARYRRKD